MKKTELLLIGAGGHARSCIDVIENHGGFCVGGLIASTEEIGQSVFGYKVLGDESTLPRLRAQFNAVLIAVGQLKTAENRIRLFRLVEKNGFELPVIISPRAHVSAHTTVGKGTIVMHNALINAGAQIGMNTIINTGALIEHDVHTGDHCHISTTAVVNGGADIGERTFIGSGCRIREGIKIGAGSVVGMGSSVFHDLPENCIVTCKK